MPEQIRGRFSDAAYGDTLQWIGAALARVEARQEVMERTLDALTAQLADLDTVLRRAAAEHEPVSPRRRTSSPSRRGDTFLRVVRAAVIAAVCLTVAAAVMHPARVTREQFLPRCATSCAHALTHDLDHDGDAW